MLEIENYNGQFKELNVSFFEALNEYGEDVRLISEDIEEFKRFIISSGANIVFFQYHYHIKELYTISEDDIQNFLEDDDFANTALTAMRTQNAKTLSLDFSRPYSLTLYCIYNGQTVGFDIFDEWLPDDLLLAESVVESLEDQFNEMFEKSKHNSYVQWQEEQEREKELRESILTEIEEYIRQDESWKKCSNMTLRKDYSRKLAERWSNQTGTIIFMSSVYRILEVYWSEYKEAIKKK